MHGATIVIMIMQLWYDPNQQPLRKKNCSNLKMCKIYVLHEIICFLSFKCWDCPIIETNFLPATNKCK